MRKASKTETMMTVSRVSRKTTRKTGTAKTSTAMLTVDSVVLCCAVESVERAVLGSR